MGLVTARARRMSPGEEADLDEAALAEVVPDGGPDALGLGEESCRVAAAGGGEGGGEVVSGEEEDVGGEVEGRVEEGVEADEAAEADEPAEARGEAADGGDGEVAEKDPEGPVAGEVGDEADGIGVEREVAGAEELEEVRKGRRSRR